ncbi:MAG: SRPBCC family protein [Pseudonocardiaceae bacterium]
MTAEVRNGTIVATEHIAAPPATVFPYFTEPALIVKWIGDMAELDPKPGGVFSLDMGEVAVRGAYIVVDPPHRLVFSWGINGSDSLPPAGSSIEVVLTPDGDNTLVVLTQRDLPPGQVEIHRAGWEHRLGLLRAEIG